MSGSRSPFYTSGQDGGLGAAFGGLAQAFLPDPGRTAQREQRLAATRLGYAQAGQIEDRALAGQRAAARLREAGTNGADPTVLANVFADVLQGADPQLLQALPGFVRGVAGAVGADPTRMGQISMGAGTSYQDTETGRRYINDTGNATSRANAGTAAGATLGAARIGADANVRMEGMRQDGQDRRFSVNTGAGTTTTLPQNSPVAPPNQTGPVTIQGVPTRDTTIAGQIAPYINPPPDEPPAVQERRRDIVAPGTAAVVIRNEGRREQITLQGELAAQLQVLRGEQAAGRLTQQGAQRLQQLELQNAGAMDRTVARNDTAVETAQIAADARNANAPRPVPSANAPRPVPSAIGRQIEGIFAAPITLDNAQYAFDGEAQRWLRTRAEELFQTGGEGVRGAPANAAEAALQELLRSNPPRRDSSLNPLSARTYGLPPSLRTTPVPGAPGTAPPAAPATAAPPANLPVVRTPADAARLAPGTMFRTPDGRTLRVPGA